MHELRAEMENQLQSQKVGSLLREDNSRTFYIFSFWISFSNLEIHFSKPLENVFVLVNFIFRDTDMLETKLILIGMKIRYLML